MKQKKIQNIKMQPCVKYVLSICKTFIYTHMCTVSQSKYFFPMTVVKKVKTANQ